MYWRGFGYLSDLVVNSSGTVPYSYAPTAQTVKEWVYVLCTTAGLYAMMLRFTGRLRALYRALALTQFTVDHAGEAVYWLNHAGQFVYVNRAACRDLGYTEADLLRTTVFDVDATMEPHVWADHWRELKAAGTLRFESTQKTRDGKLVPVEIAANIIEYEGDERNCAFVRSIADRRTAEQERLDHERKLRTVLILCRATHS